MGPVLRLCAPIMPFSEATPLFFNHLSITPFRHNCGKTFSSFSTQSRHEKKACARNPAKPKYKCSICNAVIGRKDNLIVHLRKKHGQDRPTEGTDLELQRAPPHGSAPHVPPPPAAAALSHAPSTIRSAIMPTPAEGTYMECIVSDNLFARVCALPPMCATYAPPLHPAALLAPPPGTAERGDALLAPPPGTAERGDLLPLVLGSLR